MSLQGKVAFITGGAKGLGRAFAEALLEKGAKVSLVDVNTKLGCKTEEDLQNKYGRNRAIFNQCDVSRVQDLKDCYSKTVKEFGNLDIVINNAAILDEINFERMIDINLTAVIKSSYLAADLMRKDKGGNGGIIVNVSSTSGLWPATYILAYTAVKHGVVGFSKSLALNLQDVERYGLRVATLCPSFTYTDMIASESKHEPVSYTRSDDVIMPAINEAQASLWKAMDKLGIMQVDTVVSGLLELISEPNSNGAVLRVTPLGTKYLYPKILTNKL